MECPKNVCKAISRVGEFDRLFSKYAKTNFMSVEGKVLSLLISNGSCIIKEISGLTGVSQRAVYNCLKKFEDMGIVAKSEDNRDRRFHQVSLVPENFCRQFCDKVPAEQATQSG